MAKQRLSLAAAVALDVHHASDQELWDAHPRSLNFSKSRLLSLPSAIPTMQDNDDVIDKYCEGSEGMHRARGRPESATHRC